MAHLSQGEVDARGFVPVRLRCASLAGWSGAVVAATCESLEALKLASATITQSTVVTRPLCPYPQAAMYSGAGATNDAPNFVCRSN